MKSKYSYGSFETEEHMEDGEPVVVRWSFSYLPGTPATFDDPAVDDEFEIEDTEAVSAWDDNGQPTQPTDTHKRFVANLLTPANLNRIEDKLYKLAMRELAEY